VFDDRPGLVIIVFGIVIPAIVILILGITPLGDWLVNP
jgi:hypothetical protein